MTKILKVLSALFVTYFLVFSVAGVAHSANNIEFLDKELIRQLNFGIFEVVTPKLESDKIKYGRELPFDSLGFVERNEKYYSIGTAFFINEKELMTAAHVFRLMYFSLLHDFYIRDSEGNVYPVGQIKKHSTHRDMMVFDLKTYPSEINPLELDGDVEIGDTVFSAGNAQGEGIAYRAGQVASFTPEREYGKWKDIRFSSPASPGNSGGPLLNLQGKVVGLIIKKNQSENYNIGVPIHELDNLGAKGEFHLRNVTTALYGVDDVLRKDWSYSVELPASVKDVAGLAQDDLNRHWSSLATELQEKVKERNYPHGARFRDYLRDQSSVSGLALLVPGKDFKKWSTNSGYEEKIPISESQNVFKSRGSHTDLQVIVEKPDSVGLQEFLDSPEMVMDNLLKAISLYRQVGRERVPVTSLGAPEESQIFEDKLGRKWIGALWDLPYSDMFVYTSCLPYPNGVACLVDRNKNASRKYGYFDTLHDGYNEIVVGYKGEIDDWEEYFALGEKYLPQRFKEAKISRKENRLKVDLVDYAIDFDSEKIKGESSVHFHMGYSNEKLLAEDIVLFEIFPQKGAEEHYRVQPFYEPGGFSSDKYKSEWDDVVGGSGLFSGKVVNQDEQLVIRKPVEESKTTLASIDDREIERVFTIGCYYQASEEGALKDCRDFAGSVKFHLP